MPTRYVQSQETTPPPDAVLVTISLRHGAPLADVAWPSAPDTPGGDYLYPTAVPLALDRARDLIAQYGFERILIVLAPGAVWDPAWGDLVRA